MNGPMLPGTPEPDPMQNQHINVRGYKRTRARARRTDPETSHEAAASVENLTSKQAAVLEMLRLYGPACDEVIYDRLWKDGYKMSPSGARTRRDELVDMKKVEWAGNYATMRSGRKAMVWQVISP